MKKLILALTTATLIACAPAHAEPDMIDDWAYVENIDAMTDDDRSGAITMSDGASLAILCRDGSPNVIFSPNTYLGNDSRFTVTYRIDQDKAKTTSGSISTTGTQLFLPTSLMSELEPAKRVVLRVSDFRGTPYTSEFSLIGYYDATGLLSCVE